MCCAALTFLVSINKSLNSYLNIIQSILTQARTQLQTEQQPSGPCWVVPHSNSTRASDLEFLTWSKSSSTTAGSGARGPAASHSQSSKRPPESLATCFHSIHLKPNSITTGDFWDRKKTQPLTTQMLPFNTATCLPW